MPLPGSGIGCRAESRWRRKRPNVDLLPPRFVRVVGHPTSVRRELAVAFFEVGLHEHPRLAIALHRQYPEIAGRLGVDTEIENEPAVRRPVGGLLELRGFHEEFLRARTVGG